MIVKGYKKTLINDDMWDLIPENRSENVVKQFDAKWIPIVEEKQKIASKGHQEESRVNLFWTLLKTFWSQLIILTTFKLLATLLTFGNPLLLDLLIAYMSPKSIEPEWRGYFYAILMFVTPLLQSILNGQYGYLNSLVGMKMKSATINVIYKKVRHINADMTNRTKLSRAFGSQ